jgi:hypothetical protein
MAEMFDLGVHPFNPDRAMRCCAQARPSQHSSTLASIRTLLLLTASHHDLFQNVDAFWFRNALDNCARAVLFPRCLWIIASVGGIVGDA